MTRTPSNPSGVVFGDERTNPRERRADEVTRPEAQHRAVIEAQTRLEACLAEWRLNPPTPAGRRDRHEINGLIS